MSSRQAEPDGARASTSVPARPSRPIAGGGPTTVDSVLMAGAPTGAIGTWATHRLLDTLVRCAIALVATYPLWPRDRETTGTVAVATQITP